MRQIVLDTETTGIEPVDQHNIIEIGCVEMVNRRLTGRTYHQFVRPFRDVEEEAMQVHGITDEFLLDKPRFNEIAQEFIEFVDGAELIIHNAAFDVGFLDSEFKRNAFDERIDSLCPRVIDSLKIARHKHPGQKNNLDALCRRYGIDNSHRTLHGALLDSEILADVYLMLTGGQTSLLLAAQGDAGDESGGAAIRRLDNALDLPLVVPTDEDIAAHDAFLDVLDKKSDGALWRAKVD